ncbi:MAG TPA: hypothetical protein VHG69_09040 [Thermoleophilaceae bacterium]|nr:hypothetical protein [Thermoleophilaceae bacterium]
MPTEPQPPTLADAARRAAEACGGDGVADLLRRLEDRDEPITGIADLEAELAEVTGAVDPQEEDPAVVMASAVILHLAHRRDEFGTEDQRLLEQAARDEFDGRPPEHVRAWLEERGVTP